MAYQRPLKCTNINQIARGEFGCAVDMKTSTPPSDWHFGRELTPKDMQGRRERLLAMRCTVWSLSGDPDSLTMPNWLVCETHAQWILDNSICTCKRCEEHKFQRIFKLLKDGHV